MIKTKAVDEWGSGTANFTRHTSRLWPGGNTNYGNNQNKCQAYTGLLLWTQVKENSYILRLIYCWAAVCTCVHTISYSYCM